MPKCKICGIEHKDIIFMDFCKRCYKKKLKEIKQEAIKYEDK